MKKACCLLLALILALGTLPAFAAGVSDIMRVVNCSEWVSLREMPDTSSTRLTKVYLGELVTDCAASYNGFIYCEFNGKAGYILQQYLETTNFTYGDGLLGNQMVVDVVENVSLLDSPSSSGRLLKKVPVGAIVTSCVTAGGNFVFCRYQGTDGYIRSEYLHSADYTISSQSSSVVQKYTGMYPAMRGPVEVVNCSEWVSLRTKPSTSSVRVAKVPLGTVVQDCLQVSDTFVYCCYRGVWGYIQKDYLLDRGSASGQVPAAGRQDDWPRDTLVDQTLSDGTGRRVFVQRIYTSDGEIMTAAVYDASGTLVSRMSSADSDPGQYSRLEAFIGGTAVSPVLLWFTGTDLYAHRISPYMGDDVVWSLPLQEAGISHAVDIDGTIYLIGYETDRLTCISPDGRLLWQAVNPDPDVFWPSEVMIADPVVEVRYSGGTQKTLAYSKETGAPWKEGAAGTLVRAELTEENDAYYRFASARSTETLNVLFTPAEDVRNFQVLDLDLIFGDTEEYNARVLCTLPILRPDTPMLVTMSFDGSTPSNGFAYTDSNGVRTCWALDLSGEDGSLLTWEIKTR